MKSNVSNIAAFVDSLVNNEFSVGQQAMVLVGEDALGGDNTTNSYTNCTCTNEENTSCRGSNGTCTNIKTCMGINNLCGNKTNTNESFKQCAIHGVVMG